MLPSRLQPERSFVGDDTAVLGYWKIQIQDAARPTVVERTTYLYEHTAFSQIGPLQRDPGKACYSIPAQWSRSYQMYCLGLVC